MKWHEEDAVGDEVPVWGDLEITEQTQCLGWSSPMYRARLGAALEARTAGALWSTNSQGQRCASSTQQSQPSHILGSHTHMQLTPDKYLHGKRIKPAVFIVPNVSGGMTANSQANAILRALCGDETWCTYGRWFISPGRSSGQHLSLQKH